MTRRSSVDFKNILNWRSSKNLKKIFQRTLEGFRKKKFEDILKKINKDLLKIFRRKLFKSKSSYNISSKIIHKVFRRNSAKFLRRMRSREDLHKRSSNIFYRSWSRISFKKIFTRSHSSEDLKKDLGLGKKNKNILG